MKLSKIIEAIKEDMEIYGDVEARYYRYDHVHASSESWMWSPTRRNKKGERLKMTAKELKEYVEGKIDFKAAL